MSCKRYAPFLWLLLALFCLRVVGQMLVASLDASWLPPMKAWYSGLMPYRWLLPAQLVIILLFGRVCIDFTRGRGFWVVPRPSLGSGLLAFGAIYLGAMVIRYVLRMSLYPEARWLGGAIPIFFHWVLAAFILLVGRYHSVRTHCNPEEHLGGDRAGPPPLPADGPDSASARGADIYDPAVSPPAGADRSGLAIAHRSPVGNAAAPL